MTDDPTDDELVDLEARLADPLWRLTSGKLYKIKTADGQGIIPFHPRPEQVDLLKELLAAVDGTGPRKIVRLNTCGCEPMKEETKEALAAMITAAGDMMKPNDQIHP